MDIFPSLDKSLIHFILSLGICSLAKGGLYLSDLRAFLFDFNLAAYSLTPVI